MGGRVEREAERLGVALGGRPVPVVTFASLASVSDRERLAGGGDRLEVVAHRRRCPARGERWSCEVGLGGAELGAGRSTRRLELSTNATATGSFSLAARVHGVGSWRAAVRPAAERASSIRDRDGHGTMDVGG